MMALAAAVLEPDSVLEPNTQLGPYRLEQLVGAGGMGHVYRATDTRLNRTVAIKVLPEALAEDAHFRARFEREARTIAGLTPPHICTLYDVGHQGTPADHRHALDYLVLEYVEGEPLDARLQRGALPFDQALTCAIQIADALDAAHRRGIVHRDLKPGNIMLTKGGAKLLDFGLAKPAVPAIVGFAPSHVPTTPPALTAQGTNPRDVSVHGAGAARRAGGGRAHRHLCVRGGRLRDGQGQEGVRGQEPREPDRRDHARRAASALNATAAYPAPFGPRGQEVPGEGSRRTMAN